MILLLILPLLVFLPYLGQFLFSPGSEYSDLLITHLPNALYLQRSLVEWGQLPFWSSSILSGYPFAADPLSGIWYLPGWITVLFPTALGFNLTVLVHFLFGGVGLYLFLRSDNLPQLPALLGAILFVAMPKLVAHLAAGHITLLYAISWTPWLLYAERKQLSLFRYPAWVLGPGVVLGIIALADVRWSLPAGLIWLGYRLTRITGGLGWDRGRSPEAQFHPSITKRILQGGKILAATAVQAAIGLLIAAPLLLPLMEYTQQSTRVQLTPAETFQFSLPPGRLLGLLYPSFGGYAEWVLYPTAVGLVFLLISSLIPALFRRTAFWFGVVFVCFVYALGKAIPFLPLVGTLPGFNLMRVPPRLLFLAGMSFAIIAAHATAALLPSEIDKRLGPVTRPSLGLIGLAALSLLIPAGIYSITKDLPLNFIWGSLWIAAVAIWIFLRLREKIPPDLWVLGLFIFVLVDQSFVNWKSIEPNPPDGQATTGEDAAAFLSSEPDRFRVYSPSYSLPQQSAAKYGLELADGIDPLHLAAYQDFMTGATGIPVSGYTVTIPPYNKADPDRDNAEYSPNPHLLGLLNVRYLLAEYDLPVDGLRLRARFGETRLYENLQANPRAWVQAGLSTPLLRPAEVTRWTPNQIDLEAEGPGILVLSEIDYPGWQVWVDGVQGKVIPVEKLLRGVDVPAGKHNVSYLFRPETVFTGLILGGLTWTILIAGFVLRRRRVR